MEQRLKILDIWVDSVDRESAKKLVEGYLATGSRPHSIFASNPEKNFTVPKDPELHKAYRDSDLLLPDGIGVVMAARIIYGAHLERVPGSEFIFDICEIAARLRKKVFFFGAAEEASIRAVENIKERFPGLEIAGRENGYHSKQDMPGLIERINYSGAEVLFLALGSPKQETWFGEHRQFLRNIKVVQGVGGTLDCIAGNRKRAPEYWRRANAEWLYRLMSEPGRIRRQKVLPYFVYLVLKEKLSRTI